jgi:hypothetical protein
MADSHQIVREVEQFYNRYIDGFNREDIDLFMQSFDLPFVHVSGERGATICADEAEQQRFYTQTMISIRERGWVRSGVDRMKAWPLAENLAMLMADVTRYKKDAAVLERLRAFYTLRNDGKAWKVVVIAEAKPPFPGPGDIPRG